MLMLTAASLTIGLAVTRSLVVFEVLSFLVGVASIVPQVLVPLAADLAPMNRKAGAIAIVWAALMMGVLLARVLSGVIANFVSYRNVYFMATGLQFVTFICAYLIIPNVRAKNVGMNYPQILGSMAKLAVTQPLLIQCALSILVSNMCFTNFWVTLTFLLLDPPFQYDACVSVRFFRSHSLILTPQPDNRIVWSAWNARSSSGTFPRTITRLRHALVWSAVRSILAPGISSGAGDWRRLERRSCDHCYTWIGRLQTNDFGLAN